MCKISIFKRFRGFEGVAVHEARSTNYCTKSSFTSGGPLVPCSLGAFSSPVAPWHDTGVAPGIAGWTLPLPTVQTCTNATARPPPQRVMMFDIVVASSAQSPLRVPRCGACRSPPTLSAEELRGLASCTRHDRKSSGLINLETPRESSRGPHVTAAVSVPPAHDHCQPKIGVEPRTALRASANGSRALT